MSQENWDLKGLNSFDEMMVFTLEGHWWGVDHPDNLAVSHPRCNTTRPRHHSPALMIAEDWNQASEKLSANITARLRSERFSFKEGAYPIPREG